MDHSCSAAEGAALLTSAEEGTSVATPSFLATLSAGGGTSRFAFRVVVLLSLGLAALAAVVASTVGMASTRTGLVTAWKATALEAAAPAMANSTTAAPQQTTAEPSGPCAGAGEDCSKSHCCSQQGMQCFQKDATWSSCQGRCRPGGGWSCKVLGPRTRQITPCTFPGEDCGLTHCCGNPMTKCIQKDAVGHAYCTSADTSGWEGTILGGAPGERSITPAPRGKPTAGTSLFCFMAVLPGSAEEQLQKAARDRNASIFGCNASAVYHAEPAEFIHQGNWNSFVNTDAFVKVWAQVRRETVAKQHDWTVKVDPDTIFMSERLRSHLQALRAPANEVIYIKNCNVDFGFLGAIEIMSKRALHRLLHFLEDCHRSIGSHSGEDGFLKGCLDHIGAGAMTDAAILATPADGSNCADTTRVAFHPRKDVDSWISCWTVASQ